MSKKKKMKKEKKYNINEMFYSIQGEGLFAGTAMFFIRFSGCNKKCSFCDTKHEKVNYEMTAKDILMRIQAQKETVRDVCFTGGEPCLQLEQGNEGLARLRQDYVLHIETNGTLPVPLWIHHITVSPKSFYAFHNFCNEDFMYSDNITIKVVWGTKDFMSILNGIHITDDLFIQPMADKKGNPQNLEEVIKYIKENPRWRLSLQTQKMINIK